MLLAGLLCIVLVFALGVLSKTALAHAQLRADRAIALQDRTDVLTTLARGLTTIATPETVGIAALVLIPLALAVSRRWAAALRALCTLAGALVLAVVAKNLISEHRPPQRLWALAADHGNSYPSGHATVAAAIAVTLILAATGAWRVAAILVAGAYALAVAGSRIYLADHYPLDVAGSILAALAAGFIVTGLATLPTVQARLNRLDPPRTCHEPAVSATERSSQSPSR
jgi:undecaprenyl-diphosphatase